MARTETPRQKIVDLDTLARQSAEARADGRRVVLCHGVFDLLHIGHMRYFEQARQLGDLLIVTVTPDRFVDKGAFRPAFPEDLRLEAIAALSVVDRVAQNAWPTAEQTLRTLRPTVYAKGAEFRQVGADATGKMEAERAVAEEIGCELAFIDDLVFSSSQLINLHLRSYPDEVAAYLAPLRERFSASDAAELLERIGQLSVLVVGPTVEERTALVDCLGLGRHAEPRLRAAGEHRRLAGAPDLARVLAPFAGSVELLTLADPEPIAAELPNVTLHARPPAAGTVHHSRFVDRADGKVWFSTSGGDLDDAGDLAWITDRLAELAPRHDLVLVVDHGQSTLVREPLPDLPGVHVAHLPDGGPALPNADLALWRHADGSRPPIAGARSTIQRTRDGAVELRRHGGTTTAPSFGRRGLSGAGAGDSRAGDLGSDRGPDWSDDAGASTFAAVCCLANATGAASELTLLTAQAASLLVTPEAPPSRERLRKQLTSMLK